MSAIELSPGAEAFILAAQASASQTEKQQPKDGLDRVINIGGLCMVDHDLPKDHTEADDRVMFPAHVYGSDTI